MANANYICLLLDADCHVLTAQVVSQPDDNRAVAAVKLRAQEADAWGYEVWLNGRQVVSSYDCTHPPARIAEHARRQGL